METKWLVLLISSMLTFSTGYDLDHGIDLPTRRPLNIAHRGSSGMFPDHTAEGYRKAIEQGADIIECDVTVTRDLQLVCLHESWINATTNVAQLFPDRWTTRVIDGEVHQDYFCVDFTLAELQQLGVRQRYHFRDHSYDLLFKITTLEEHIMIAKSADHLVGIYPETKHPKWVNSLDIIKNANTTLEDLLVNTLHKHGYKKKTDPCFIQSFNEASLLYVSRITNLPLVRLYKDGPISDSMMLEWSSYLYGIAPKKELIVEVDPLTNYIRSHTDLVLRAHAHGMVVHPYVCQNEHIYLAFDYGLDPYAEYKDLLSMGVDGLFTDFPASLALYLELTDREYSSSSTKTIGMVADREESGVMVASSILMTVVWFKGFAKRDVYDFIYVSSLIISIILLKGLFCGRF